jgi:hypothetical protein
MLVSLCVSFLFVLSSFRTTITKCYQLRGLKRITTLLISQGCLSEVWPNVTEFSVQSLTRPKSRCLQNCIPSGGSRAEPTSNLIRVVDRIHFLEVGGLRLLDLWPIPSSTHQQSIKSFSSFKSLCFLSCLPLLDPARKYRVISLSSS